MEIQTRGQVKVEMSNHAIFFNVNKPLLETLFEHYFAINGLSWKSRNGTKIEQICLRTNSGQRKVYVDDYFKRRTCNVILNN